MKKLFSLPLIGLMLMLGGQAAAQRPKTYVVPGFEERKPVTEVVPGQHIVFQEAQQRSLSVLTGNMLSSSVEATSVYELEEAGADTRGVMTYRIKQTETGLYMVSPDINGWAYTYTSDLKEALRCYVRHPEQLEKGGETNTKDHSDPSVFAIWNTSNYRTAPEDAYIITNVNYRDKQPYNYVPTDWSPTWMTNRIAGALSWSTYAQANLWYIYEAKEVAGYDALQALFYNLFPEGSVDDYGFIRGDEPGELPADLYDALMSAFSRAVELLGGDGTQPEATYDEAGDKLYEAIEAAKNGLVPMREGYYFVVNHRGPSFGMFEYSDKNEIDCRTGSWKVPETPTLANASEIWQFISVNDNPNEFVIRNFLTGHYIGYSYAGDAAPFPTVDTREGAVVYTVLPHDIMDHYWFMSNRAAASYTAIHAQWNANIARWTEENESSGWKLTQVDPKIISELEAAIEDYQKELAQQQLNESLYLLASSASAAYNNGVAYTSDAKKDGTFDEADAGLLKGFEDYARIWTNAQETSQGAIENVIDNDIRSFFHSKWTSAGPDGEYHHICVDLGNELEAVVMKYCKRVDWQNAAPVVMHVYATNDTTGYANHDYSKWVDQGSIEFTYTIDLPSVANSDGFTNPGVGLSGVGFDKPYRFMRLDVEKNLKGGTNGYGTKSVTYMTLGELHFYAAQPDPANSINNAISPDVINPLLDELAKARAEIAAGKATQEQIDALQDAYDTYVAAFPQPQKAIDALAEAQSMVYLAEEGTQLGQFQSGATDELSDALDAISERVGEVMTADEVNAAIDAINAAVAQFNTKLNKPEDGKFYRIVSKAASTDEGSPKGSYLYAIDNGWSQVLWGGNATDTYLDSRMNYIWQVVRNADGTFSFQNAATGTRLQKVARNNGAALMGVVVPDSLDYNHDITFGLSTGAFRISEGDGIYLQARPSYSTLIGVNNVSMGDAATFGFEEVTAWEPAYFTGLTSPVARIMTLPFEIDAQPLDCQLYYVLGIKDDKLQLKEYAKNAVIPAGTPFIVIPSDDEGMEGIELYPTASSLEELEYVYEPVPNGSLRGVLRPVDLELGSLIISGIDGVVSAARNGEYCNANTGYLEDLQPTTEDGDIALLITDDVLTGVAPAATLVPAGNAAYDLQGRRIVKLQKGLYIVNGKKVLVK